MFSRFRPSLTLTLSWLVALAILLSLGTWQMQRREWKNGLVAELEAGLAAAPVALPATVTDIDALRFHRVSVTGRFDHSSEIHLVRARGGRNGFQVLTPLVRPAGPAVLVDRGWVPRELKDPSQRAEGQVTGPVEVTGMVRTGSAPGWFVPDNDLQRNMWFHTDYAAIGQATGQTLLPLTVIAEQGPKGAAWPQVHRAEFNLRNNHLEYAVTWYSLALIMTVIFVMMGRARARNSGATDGSAGQ